MLDNPYTDSLELRVHSATPLELVAILYDAAIEAVRAARGYLASGEIHARSRSVTKAVNILIELHRALNFEAGGELSKRLAGLYDFMQRTLLDANFRQADDGLAKTEELLVSLREAWHAVSRGQQAVTRTGHPPVEAHDHAKSPAAFPWPGIVESAQPARSWNA